MVNRPRRGPVLLDVTQTLSSELRRSSSRRGPAIHHVGYVVDDLRRAAEIWYTTAGVGPFVVFEHIAFDGLTGDGSAVTFDHTAAFAVAGDNFIELQVLHAVDERVAHYLRPRRGVGANHLAIAVDDAVAHSERLAARGHPGFLHAHTAGLSSSWHDARSDLGLALEVHQRSAALDAFFDVVRSADRHWDHQDVLQYPTM